MSRIKKPVQITLTESTWNQAKARAEKRNLNFSIYIQLLIEEDLKKCD